MDEDGKIYDEINVVPLLDLSFVLTVIFILIATAAVVGIKVDLPRASNTEAIAASDTVAVSITPDGQVYMNGFPVTVADFERRIREIHAVNADIPVVVRGDTQTAYGRIMEVLDILKGVGIAKIGLPAEEITN